VTGSGASFAAMQRADAGAAGLPAAAAALVAAALFFGHGSSDSRLFWTGVPALLLAAVARVLRPPRLSGAAFALLCLLGGLVVWQALTIAWSIQPSRSWDFANRGLVYFAFACVGLALAPVSRAWIAAGLGALLTGLLIVALAAKVVPGLYDDYGRFARLRWPLAYWNQLALLAAVTVVLGLWLAGRGERPLRARVAGALHVYVALVAVVLTFSRFGIALAVLGAAVWTWLDRERLDSVGVLAAVIPPAAIVAGVGLALPGIADDGQSHSVRVHDGLIFGVLLVAGALVAGALARAFLGRAPNVAQRQRAAIAGAVGFVLLCTVGLVVLAVRAGGPADFVRARWHEFSATQSLTSAERLGSASSGNRWHWWQQAWDAFTHHPAGGTGAGSFDLTSTVAAHNSQQSTVEPHNTPLQVLSETGIVGFLLYAGVIASVIVGVARGPRDRATQALALALAIGWVHSLIDIDWSYVATQGPLFLVAGVLVARPGERVRRRVLQSVAVGIACLAAAYSLFSPWYSGQRLSDALDAVDRENLDAAAAAAADAHSLNPLAIEPTQLLAALNDSERLFREATTREPTNPDTWYQLAEYYARHDRWRAAYDAVNRSYTLDPYGPAGFTGGLLDRARCAIDPATCSPADAGTVPIPSADLRRLLSIARREARAAAEPHPAGAAYVTTRGRFAPVASGPPMQVIYAVVLRGHFVKPIPSPPGGSPLRGRYLLLVIDPRTFSETDLGVVRRPPDTSRLGLANPLSLR
jgi:hypothetical protein